MDVSRKVLRCSGTAIGPLPEDRQLTSEVKVNAVNRLLYLHLASFVILAVQGALPLSGKVFAQEFEIELMRPTQPGLKYKARFRSSVKGVSTLEFEASEPAEKGELPKSVVSRHMTTIDFDANVTVISTAGNQVTEQSMFVTRWQFDDMGDSEGVDLNGETIVFKRQGKAMIFEIDGSPLDEYANKLMTMTVAPFAGVEDSDVPAEGTSSRRIGESWTTPHNQGVIKGILPQDFWKYLLDDNPLRERTFTLVKRTDVQDAECLEITSSLRAQNIIAGTIEAGAIESSEVEWRTRGLFPLNKELQCPYFMDLKEWRIVTTTSIEGVAASVRLDQRVSETAERWILTE